MYNPIRCVHSFITRPCLEVSISINLSSQSRVKYAWRINDTLNVHDIILHIVVIVQSRELCELGAPRGHVHVRLRSLEWTALWSWLEGLDNVLAVVLVWAEREKRRKGGRKEDMIAMSIWNESRLDCALINFSFVQLKDKTMRWRPHKLVYILSRKQWPCKQSQICSCIMWYFCRLETMWTWVWGLCRVTSYVCWEWAETQERLVHHQDTTKPSPDNYHTRYTWIRHNKVHRCMIQFSPTRIMDTL